MKLQLRKVDVGGACPGALVLTDETGRMLPGQVSTHVVSEGDSAKLIVEFSMWCDGITLSDLPPLQDGAH